MPVAAPRNSVMTFRIVEAFVVPYSAAAAAVVVVVVAIAVEHSMASVCRGGCRESHAHMCVMIGSSEFKQTYSSRPIAILPNATRITRDFEPSLDWD